MLTKNTIFASSKFLVYTLDLDGEGIKTEYFARVALFLSLFFSKSVSNASPPLLKESTGVSVFIKYVVLFRIDITYEMVFTNGHQEISQITTISVHIPMMAVRKTLRKYRLVFHSIVQVIL